MRASPLLLLLLIVACGDDDGAPDATMDAPDADVGVDAGSDVGTDAGPPPDYATMDVPHSTTPEPGVRRELVIVPGVTPPPNPTTGSETPAELNATRVARYRADVEPAREARAVIVAMPGFLAGVGSLDGLARGLVRESSGLVEVWVIDRRANLAEDLRGMNTAEASGHPEIADQFYFGDATLDGERFSGFARQADLDYASEWGLETHVGDVHQVIAQVPAAERQARVFLLGHSLGASFAEAYAGWRFEDGTRGVDELAGVILVDGVLANEPGTEESYRDGSTRVGFPTPGVTEIRERERVASLPLLGVDIYARAEIMSLRVLDAPEATVMDRGRDSTFNILFGYRRSETPRLTNEAALAFAFDDASGPLAFARAKLGEFDGATEDYTSGIFDSMLVRPPAGSAMGWVDAPAAGEVTGIAEFASAFTHGGTNFAEWYFPYRLTVDLEAVGGAAIAEASWQADEGLRVFDGPRMDAPVLAVACALVGDVDAYEAVRARIAPAIGEGRPAAGTSRDVDAAFAIVDATSLAHLDPGLAGDASRNPTIGAALAFALLHAPESVIALSL